MGKCRVGARPVELAVPGGVNNNNPLSFNLLFLLSPPSSLAPRGGEMLNHRGKSHLANCGAAPSGRYYSLDTRSDTSLILFISIS